MDLSKLAEPFPPDDIEWRISRSGANSKGVWATCLAYITARAIQNRLDAVCGPDNWLIGEPRIIDVNGKTAFAVGISIRCGCDLEWITKWDVSEPTNIEPAKGGFSGAMKRAGAQWGIGRYLYRMDETFAEVAEESPPKGTPGWNWARLSEKNGGATFWWQTPSLPSWAMPKDPEHEIKPMELDELKQQWRAVFAPDSKNPKELREGFTQFVESVAGGFPSSDYTCWTRDALERCQKRISETTDPTGVRSDVPFEE